MDNPPSHDPGTTVKEKELRVALVCYGGVSLAVYQHGITKEILKLVRASKAYHAVVEQRVKQHPSHTYRSTGGDAGPPSTERLYFDILKSFGARGLDLRVIVDVIAGASSGGINGVILARALAHDLALDPVTRLWLEEVDISLLLAPEARAHRWSKWYVRPFVRPFLWFLARHHRLAGTVDREMGRKLSMFLRSRWFEPPLDGGRLTALLLDALQSMGEPGDRAASLLPANLRLDLLVTVTDASGAERRIYLHDPPVIREREHRHVLRFACEHLEGVGVRGDFDLENTPALAFASRATSSFPGAFPPAQLAEIDAVVAARGQSWPRRERFLARSFRHYLARGLDPGAAALLDGSVLDNKPFRIALEAVITHAAFREVDRRLVFIDPHAKSQVPPGPVGVPGFFGAIRGALSDLPRYEPIYDEIGWVGQLNEQTRRQRAAIEVTRPYIVKRIEGMAGEALDGPVTPERLQSWRMEAGRLLIADERVSYNEYMRLMIDEAVEFLVRIVCEACGHPPGSPQAEQVATAMALWARRHDIYLTDYTIPVAATSETGLLPSMQFMVAFNLAYRFRRIHFVIEAINGLYPRIGDPRFCGASSGVLDAFKARLYLCLQTLRVYEKPGFPVADVAARIRAVFGGLRDPSPDSGTDPASAFVERNDAALTALVDELARECDFVRLNEEADAALASPAVLELGPACRREVLIAYLGFVFWDIVLLPMIRARELHAVGELGEILVDRISPDDATTLSGGCPAPCLRGAELGGFGAFFSAPARENDYLWGRLHGVDRLVDLLASSAGREISGDIDFRALKKRGFEMVLQEESGRLRRVPDLLARLAAAVDRL